MKQAFLAATENERAQPVEIFDERSGIRSSVAVGGA
jgi:hypothetical protein